jgi:hypothetical protein
MIARPEFAHLAIGETMTIDGIPMRHAGGGLFEPAVIGDELLKRFDVNEGETLHRPRAA